jgi:hypothetical protein
VNLKGIVTRYLAITGSFGRPAALTEFGPDPAQIAVLFSGFDEDYHISRYFHFAKSTGPTMAINGFEHTHVTIDPEIQEIL